MFVSAVPTFLRKPRKRCITVCALLVLPKPRSFAQRGEELKAKIQAEADRERIGIIAEANRKAEVLRGEGDGQRNVILGKAYGQDAEFFEFYRSLEAYKIALDNGSTMVLSPDSEFFQYFNKSGPATSR